METTFSMTRVQHIMRRDLIENWKSNLYGLLGIFAACFFHNKAENEFSLSSAVAGVYYLGNIISKKKCL